MNFDTLIQRIFEIAKMHPDGFTVRIPNLEPVTTGYIVAFKATQNSFDKKGLEHCVQHALENQKVVGGWLNEENGKFYFDSCKIFHDSEKALSFGRLQEQIAVYDLNENRSISL